MNSTAPTGPGSQANNGTPNSGASAPLTQSDISKLIQDQLDRDQKWLKFAQDQAANDRTFFQHLFTRTVWFLGILLAVVGVVGGFLGVNSLNQIRDQAKLTVDAEVARTKIEVEQVAAEAKAKVQQQLDIAHTEVTRRVEAEFRTEQITGLVQRVAKQKTEQELNGVIRSEVVKGIQQQSGTIKEEVVTETKNAVQELQPTIANIVHTETEGQVTKAVEPVRNQMAEYDKVVTFNTLATMAKNGDRTAFDRLNSMDTYKDMMGLLGFGKTVVEDIIRQHENSLRMSRKFNEAKTTEQMKSILDSAADVNARLTALDQFPEGDHSIVPLLINVIEHDKNLQVVYTAFQVLNRETKQKFRFPDYSQPLAWWEANKDTWK